MIKSNVNFAAVKRGVEELFKHRVEVVENLGRNKYVRFSGVVSGVYPALFTVLPDKPRFNGKTSFSYSEIMCGNVKLKKLAP